MERNVLWATWTDPGIEHLHLVEEEESVSADGLVISLSDASPFRARYRIRCDQSWRVREVRIELLGGASRHVELRADGKGHWTSASGEPQHVLEGCYDVDISATPFTNTLPIRRLGLRPGQAAELRVVYLAVPELEFKTAEQRYTCLETSSEGGRYRYEGLFRHFTAELMVDADGLVVDYPETFRRIWPR